MATVRSVKSRPWGVLDWLLNRVSISDWNLVGCISMEDRSIAAWQALKNSGKLNKSLMFQLSNGMSSFEEECQVRISEVRNCFLTNGGSLDSINPIQLFDRIQKIDSSLSSFVGVGVDNVVLDISCLPKRFFFLIVRLLLKRSLAKNILITYTVPRSYDNNNPLAGDPEPWTCLPGFIPPVGVKGNQVLIVGLGYEPLGLPQILESSEFNGDDIKILFPFPSPSGGFEKNWRFALEIARRRSPESLNIERVDNKDVSQIFDKIKNISNDGSQPVVLAPYGPKPMSLAMCLYAVSMLDRTPVPVYYTQPRSYSPYYSTGVSVINHCSEIYGYFVRINGNDLYQ